jgi:lauroyl/myristoyl acyltransferase
MSFFQKAIKRVWVETKFGIFRGTSWASSKLPLRFNYAVASLVGDFIYLTWKRHSANAVSNMRRVLGPDVPWQVVKHTTRRAFHNYAKTIADFLRFPHMTQKEIEDSIVKREGINYLHEAHKGKGVLVISGHIGNWDMAAATMVGFGITLNAVSETHEPKKMDDLVNGTRERAGMKIIRLDTSSLKQMFTALKRNEAVTILFDKPEPENGVPVQFFGETAYVPAGPAAIALKTGASIIAGYCVRRKDDKTFLGVVEPPIEYQDLLTGDKVRDIQIITQEIVSTMERVIRRYPDQWYMFREMWPRTEMHDAEVRQKRFWGGRNHVEMVKG